MERNGGDWRAYGRPGMYRKADEEAKYLSNRAAKRFRNAPTLVVRAGHAAIPGEMPGSRFGIDSEREAVREKLGALPGTHMGQARHPEAPPLWSEPSCGCDVGSTSIRHQGEREQGEERSHVKACHGVLWPPRRRQPLLLSSEGYTQPRATARCSLTSSRGGLAEKKRKTTCVSSLARVESRAPDCRPIWTLTAGIGMRASSDPIPPDPRPDHGRQARD